MNTSEIVPFSLKDAPSLIERLWPAQKISAEAQKERKAGSGQTLTALGSYWKGRKPLVLVRACILGALLPATDNAAEDLAVFELLMRIDDEAFLEREMVLPANTVAKLVVQANRGVMDTAFLRDHFSILPGDEKQAKPRPAATDEEFKQAYHDGRTVLAGDLDAKTRRNILTVAIGQVPYSDRVRVSLRPEELSEEAWEPIWPRVNAHLGTDAHSISSLIEQLGIMRFGHRPRVADTFAGGGSIPFEAARIGCEAFASDLNPIACMLTWGALNIIGADELRRQEIDELYAAAAKYVDEQVTALGFEEDDEGNRAKSFLYCLETYCPETDWTVPICQSWVISNKKRVVVTLVPNHTKRRFDFAIIENATDAQMKRAQSGTKQGDFLVYELDGVEHRKAIKTIRGDYRREDGTTGNALRPWTRDDIEYREGDIFRERLYCIQWISAQTIDRGRQETFYAAPTDADVEREQAVSAYIRSKLHDWQERGIIPDMVIEPGEETTRLCRERGWTHWHHLFSPRNLLVLGLMGEALRHHPAGAVRIAHQANWNAKGCQWFRGFDTVNHSFEDQSLKTKFDYAARSSFVFSHLLKDRSRTVDIAGSGTIVTQPAKALSVENDIFITDPPYADAVNYHEITEFFIAWLRKNPPAPFDAWKWDSRRPLAIKGDGEEFRREMTAAYKAMADHMPDNGIQVVMFTHQSGAVWADMAQIFWGAGLQVQAAWYIATETTSELKKGGYVQGTVILVLRKRGGDEAGYEDEIAQEVRAEVARQIDTLIGLNQAVKGSGRMENLFEDADLQMAGYAAALRVLTGYTRIDGRDLTAEATRPRQKGEKGFVDRIIEFAVQVANEHMVPEGLTPRLWQHLTGTERFYLKMIDLEAADLKKLDNYQNFARAFRVPDYTVLMANVAANAAALKRADDFKNRSGFDIPDFGQGVIRAILYAVYELGREAEPDVVMDQLRGIVENYYRRRDDLIEVAEYLASQRGRDDEREGRYAGLLAQLIRNERIG